MKKLLVFLMISILACFALTACSGNSNSDEEESLEFQLNEDKTGYIVVGLGNCTNKEICVPSTYEGLPVVAIGDKAFYNCSDLTSIIVPNGITYIGDEAFYNCSGLTNLDIPDTVTYIGKECFSKCGGLTHEEDASYIGNDQNPYLILFYIYEDSSSFTIRSSTKIINNSAFSRCKSLRSIYLHEGITCIGDKAFYNCEQLQSINIPDSVTHIGDYAFAYCDSLAYVTIGSGVTSIGNETFYNCHHLFYITIPDTVTYIGSYAFNDCQRLKSINYQGTEAEWNTIVKCEGWDELTEGYTVVYNYTGD